MSDQTARDTAGAAPGQRQGDARRSGLRTHPVAIVVGLGMLVIVGVAVLLWWLHARNYEATDDAFIDTHFVRLAPQTAGRVTEVLVRDNQMVRAGDEILTIDSADLRAKAAQAGAQRAQAVAQAENALVQIGVSEATWRQSLADLAAAEAPAVNAAQELARYRRLEGLNRLAVSQQQLDMAAAAARQTAAQRDAAARASETRQAQVSAARSQLASAKDAIGAAQAQLDQANVSLGYASLIAPVSGHVTQKSVEVGDYVQPGTQVLAIVPLDVWVTANFKETQLKRIRPGQKVSIKIDACPEDHLRGHVDSIQRGAGQAFSVLPAENATGNYVKVVQRVPVKIVFDNIPADCPLGPGMSVTPTVQVR